MRFMFGEAERRNNERLLRLSGMLEESISRYERSRARDQAAVRHLRLLSWLRSLQTTFDELEHSIYVSGQYAERVVHFRYVEEMSAKDEANYRRHLYYYKNGFIRVFSVLDKLGSFLNELLQLETEQVKERFSYFTVLRRMREKRMHLALWSRLNGVKVKYASELQELRLMRNHEVHAMNSELLDNQGRIRVRPNDRREQIDDLLENMETLHKGFEAVFESLLDVFTYLHEEQISNPPAM